MFSISPNTQTCSWGFPFDYKSPDLADRLTHSSAHLPWGTRARSPPAALRASPRPCSAWLSGELTIGMGAGGH